MVTAPACVPRMPPAHGSAQLGRSELPVAIGVLQRDRRQVVGGGLERSLAIVPAESHAHAFADRMAGFAMNFSFASALARRAVPRRTRLRAGVVYHVRRPDRARRGGADSSPVNGHQDSGRRERRLRQRSRQPLRAAGLARQRATN
jgi:hypothetical protein